MAQLTKGMFGMGYGRVDSRPARELFGFSSGHISRQDLIHNGGWYNKAGEWLGWGDLSPLNLKRLAEVLEEGEIFVVLYERDRAGNGCEDATPTFLAENAGYVVTKDVVHYVDRYGDSKGEKTVDMHYDLTCQVLSPEAFAKMLGVEIPAKA
jgi:hypothetical protein